MSADARRKNRKRREKGRTPRKWKVLERSGKWRANRRPGTRGVEPSDEE